MVEGLIDFTKTVVTNELYEDLPNEGCKVLLGKC